MLKNPISTTFVMFQKYLLWQFIKTEFTFFIYFYSVKLWENEMWHRWPTVVFSWHAPLWAHTPFLSQAHFPSALPLPGLASVSFRITGYFPFRCPFRYCLRRQALWQIRSLRRNALSGRYRVPVTNSLQWCPVLLHRTFQVAYTLLCLSIFTM